jgi:hypothetical protein
MRWDFFHKTESAKPVTKVFTYHITTTDPAEALAQAKTLGLPKGSHRRGCFEIQGDAGIWQHQDEKRIDFAQPQKIVFISWDAADSE